MIFTSPSSIFCTIGGLEIYWYGVILGIAIIIGTLISDYIGYKFLDLKKDTFIELSPYLIIFGIIGARLYYCCLNYEFYLRFPTEILAIRHGGISIHGAILGGFVALFMYSKWKKLPLLKLCDVSVFGLSLAQAIGRWGNFFNSEAFGLPTNLPWKLYIAPQYRPIPFTNYEYFHPTFLYESILNFIIFCILFILCKKFKFKKDGNFAFIYLILYSVVRIFVEHLRIDSAMYVCGIPVAIIVSLGIIVLSILILLYRNTRISGK